MMAFQKWKKSRKEKQVGTRSVTSVGLVIGTNGSHLKHSINLTVRDTPSYFPLEFEDLI
jgi:hypothetical protein